jgi:hypothetical protein
MLLFVLVPLLLFLGQGSGSNSTDIAGLTAWGEDKSISELDEMLKMAIEGGTPVLDAGIIASWSQAMKMNTNDLVSEALRMNYQYVLLCAQSIFLRDWNHPRDYHLFYARSFGMPWINGKLWEGIEFDWGVYWREILRADNV